MKFLEAGLVPKGVGVNADANEPLGVNKLNVLFLSSTPVLRTSPGWYNLLVSLDVIADSDATQTSRRKAALMARSVDEVLSIFSLAKQDWSNPASPVALGSFLLPDFWGQWRRVPDPESRFEHLNRTLTVKFFEEKR